MKAKPRKTRETRAAYRARTSKSHVPKATPIKPGLSAMPIPDGPTWQELETWRVWKREHLAKLEQEFPGKYVAIWKNKVIATGATLKETFHNAHSKNPDAVPWVTYIPTLEEMELAPIFVN